MHLIPRRLRDERGFTLVVVMSAMLVTVGLAAAALAATGGDQRASGVDRERKQAYAAAEAGVNDYLARLTANPDYWKKCTDPGVNDSLTTWVGIPTTTSQYRVELLPANGYPACSTDPAKNQSSVIDATTGTFRIRATGRAFSGTRYVRRSIVVTFRRRGFLDYIYFTDFETQDPLWYTKNADGKITKEDAAARRDVVTWGNQDCVRYWRDGRGSQQFVGTSSNLAGMLTGSNPNSSSSWTSYAARCGEIQFGPNDKVLGPFHTNDEILVCGNPQFGRSPADDIEVTGRDTTGTGEGWRPSCSGASPLVNQPGGTGAYGTWRRGAPRVDLPPSNGSLKTDTLPAYRFVGPTTITLNGDNMTVTGKRENGQTLTNVSMPLPRDGVIYASNDPSLGACTGYDPLNPYGSRPACGDIFVSGTYNRSITITSENDLIVKGSITRTAGADVMLGLIADDWIRVYHPTTGCTATTAGQDASNALGDVTIQAAILTLKHSFTVDSFWCGSSRGTLTVNGAIGQKFRGPVGQTGGNNPGYIKNYTYDDRLRFRSPPKFLDPVQASWKLKSQVEQVRAQDFGN